MDTFAGLLTLCVLLGIISNIDGACTYPTNLHDGSFFTTSGDTLNFTSTTMAKLAVHTFGSFTFTCDLSSGTQYVSKSELFYRFGLPFEAFICMEMTEVSTNQYTFYQPTTELSDAGNMRIKIFLEGKTISSISEVCDVADTTNLTDVRMIKDGSIDTEKITCPTDLQGYYSYEYDSGSGNVCNNSTELDTCTDTTLMSFNLTLCTQIQAYSAGGQLNCLHYSTVGDYTNLVVYNRDTSVDQSTTYRLSCYVISTNSTTVYATQYPNGCYSGQTSTSVNSPGATVVFTQTATCPVITTTTTTEAPSDTSTASTGIIVGVIVLLLAILLIVLFAIWFWWKKKKEKEEEERRRKEQEDLEEGLSDGLPDESKYDIDRLMYTPDQLLTPSNIHPKVTGKILDRDNFEGFGDDEYIDEFGWQDMIDAKDFMTMRKRRDGKDEFEVGDAKDKASKKKVKDLMKSKKKKKKKGKKKKKKGKSNTYETDDEYEDIDDDAADDNAEEGEASNRRELTIYLNGTQDEEEDDDSPSDSRRKARFEETDDEKVKRKRKKKKKKRKKTKGKRSEQPMSFKSFRKRKVNAWLDKNSPTLEGDPIPMFYEDPKLKPLPPLQRVNRKTKPTLWTDILKKFGGDFKEFEFQHKRNMSENRWRKLLEELYTDKKYFDYVNKSSRGRNVEDDLKSQAKDGLDYLYDRATFWEEQRPIPPRPVSMVPPLNLNSAKKSPRVKKKKGIRHAPPTPMTQVRMDSMDEFQMPPRETTF
ncbi:uncharacterized protein LOC110440309 isoform X2 [Mizuhopecten yessoensis]|uniref:uncharacterized protein LOC110440309 isoform X2 n=1 Tax=Mizuhopecten yessoensis TaxID=6573 RepID=UPI000B45ADF8|nr:uncharacterized protein LOC110440309 isoform X2 [Mizuhopecten yessoensis]